MKTSLNAVKGRHPKAPRRTGYRGNDRCPDYSRYRETAPRDGPANLS